ncbi:MAG: TIGR04283 family arsenosugar biosynthesis glycosyltransferase [Pseudomonadota bacterium]
MSAELSVIIPTLNAANRLGPCLGAVSEGLMAGLVRELILADGGSEDRISAVADDLGARLVTAPRGRGTQLHAGAEAATGRWLLFLHADTLLPPDWAGTVARHIRENPTQAGYFDLRFDSSHPMARMTAAWANLRAWIFALPYGDQALLVSASLYAETGGFPAQPLMEDVAFARILGRRRLTRLAGQVTTSAERYAREGWLRRGGRNLLTLALYLAGRDPEKLVAWYRGGSAR